MAEDMQGCEHCSKTSPIETMTMMGEYWFCQGCYDAWKIEFDACDHRWAPEESEFGEPGQYCDKCSGFRLLDIAPDHIVGVTDMIDGTRDPVGGSSDPK